MKTKILLIACAFFSFQFGFSQATEGVISYTEEVFNPRAEEFRERMERRGMKIDIPDVNTQKMTLYFGKDESIYKVKEQEEEAYDGPQRGGRRFSFRFGGGSGDANGYYREVGKKKKLQEKSILGKSFVIEDEEPDYKWKITGRSERLGEYQVMEATTIVEKDTIVAWFTPQIPVSTGPAEFSQLPGTILRVDVNQGKRVIYATNIDIRELEKDETFEKPTKGKKVTQEEFSEIRNEKHTALVELYGEERANQMLTPQ